MNVDVEFRDTALVALVLHATREVDGVVCMQQRPVSSLVRRLVGARPDASAVELGRDPDGTLVVGVRVVVRLLPAPRHVIDAVERAVLATLATAGERRVSVEVTVTDVRR